MASDQICTAVVSSGLLPGTLQSSQSLSAQQGLTLKVWREKTVLYSLTMSQLLGMTN